jgi:NADH dehydrogenase
MLGTQVVRLLTTRGLTVRILSRNRARARDLAGDAVEVVVGDVRDPTAVRRAAAGAQTIVSAVHGFAGAGATSPDEVDHRGNINLIDAARAAGTDHFVLVSIQGASADHPLELFRMKYRAEQALRASGLSWTILRPTAFMELWAKLVAAPLVKTGKTVIFGRGRNPNNFVSVYDVARFVELAVVDPAMRGVSLEVGGPQNLSFEDVVEIVQRETGRRGSVRHVPLPMMRVASLVVRAFNRTLARQIAAGVVMDTADMTFDASPLSRSYPLIPLTSFAEVVRRDFAAH